MRKSAYINSASRDIGGTPEDFTITISPSNERYSYPPKSVKLTSANIPYTWDNILSINNQFNLIESPNPPILITIPPGNYSGTNMAAAVKTALNSSGAAHTYTVTFDDSSLLFTFTANAGTFVLDFTHANSMANRLGFPVNFQTPAAISTTSTQFAEILTDTEIFVCSDLVEGVDNGFAYITPGSPTNDQILAVINITGSFGNVIEFRARQDDPFYPVTQSSFGKLQTFDKIPRTMGFSLRFPSQFPLNLGGLNWSMTLAFEF